MGFQRSGSNEKLLYIESENMKVYFTGNADNKKFNAINKNHNIPAKLTVDSDADINVKSINQYGELEKNITGYMKPSFFETGYYQLVVENLSKCDIEVDHIDKEIKGSILEIGGNLYGSFSFNGDIGYSKFIVKQNKKPFITITIEVFPSKMDYMKDYKEIINEVNEEVSSLVFDFLGKTFETASLIDTNHQTGIEFSEILKNIYQKFERSLQYIAENFKYTILSEDKVMHTEKAKRVSRKSLSYIRKNGHLLESRKDGAVKIGSSRYMPRKIVETRKTTTNNIYENQCVKHIIKNTNSRIRTVKDKVQKLYGKENARYELLDACEAKLRWYLNTEFKHISDLEWGGKNGVSLTFKMSSGYRELYYNYMLLSKGLDISDGLFEVTPKKLWNLYEIWCYIKLHKILKDLGFSTINSGIIEARDNGVTLALTKSREAKTTYKDSRGKSIELWYNRVYSHLPTTSQKPDTVLCLRNSENKDRIYIFDAKYRLSISNGKIGPMEEDINVMHRYRDAIVSELDEQSQFKYDTFGAYVMFPYDNELEYKEHKYYKSIEKVNVGAFPMLPGSTDLIRNHIHKIVSESYIESTSNLPTHNIEDDYMKFKNTNVMVANVYDKPHLDKYLKHKFYHIPCNKLSNVRLGIEYIAFYQSKSSFKEKSGVYHYGKIKEVKKYKRKECVEIPTSRSKGDEDYLRFELESIFPIGPIKTVEYGVELITYTTLYLLKNAETIHELHFKDRKEIELYKVLKELSLEKNIKIERRKEYFLVDTVEVEILSRSKLRVSKEIIDWDYCKDKVISSLDSLSSK